MLEPAPPPRPLRLGAIPPMSGFLLLFGGIWLLVGTILTTVFTLVGGPFWQDLVLDQRGVEAQALPGAVEGTNATSNGEAVQRIRYSFTDRDGATQQGDTGTTDSVLVQRAMSGQPLTVVYDPGAPALSRIAGEKKSFFGLLILLPLGFAGVGAIIFGLGLRSALRARRLYVHGEAVRAEVTGSRPSNMRVNGRRLMIVEYRFMTRTGAVNGSATHSSEPQEIGSELWVLHDPDDATTSIVA